MTEEVGSLPATEAAPPLPQHLELLDTRARLRTLHAAYDAIQPAVAHALPNLERVVDALVTGWRQGGRLILAGAGSSGRLAVAEAAECPPTFGTPPERVLALMAGGPQAVLAAAEGAEDDGAAGWAAAEALRLVPADTVVGISASGGAAFVRGVLRCAGAAGACTVALTAVADSPLVAEARLAVVTPTGPEPLAGSTRLKAATAHKIVLDLLTTAAMAALGHVFRSRMVEVRPTNAKLRARAVRTLAELAALPVAEAAPLLDACDGSVKVALLAALRQLTPAAARAGLEAAGGDLHRALAATAPTPAVARERPG